MMRILLTFTDAWWRLKKKEKKNVGDNAIRHVLSPFMKDDMNITLGAILCYLS